MREVKSSRGTYSSADSRALMFGLGDRRMQRDDAPQVAMDVRWTDGDGDAFRAGRVSVSISTSRSIT